MPPTIDLNLQIPELLHAHPHLRLILDKYGLKGCGGELGPAETLGFFARAHGVDPALLQSELSAALAAPPSEPAPAFQPGLGDTIYRLFFKGAIVVALTAGVTWGAFMLLKIGFEQRFSINPLSSVNAHGHAMIFGWVGLFVMGFAYQAFPRYRHTELYRPRLAVATFYLMAAGILLRVICEPLHEAFDWAFYGGFLACGFELLAVTLFIFVLQKTFAKSGKRYEVYDYYILAALGFFFLQALWDTALLWLTTTASDPALLVRRVAAYQAPLRDLQIHGFATFMILGVSQRLLPTIYGFKAPSERLARLLLGPLILAVMGEVVFFCLRQRGGGPDLASWMLYFSMLAFGGIVTALALNWKVFKPCPEPDRSVKFLQAAYGWLLFSVVLLAAMPFYMAWYRAHHEIGFSHAYYGATRHAITVGFITLMILGVAAKIVPTLAGLEISKLTGLWPTFVLVNTGCLLRVVFQMLTDLPELAPFAYPLAGISGVLELTGIALWGVHLWRVMDGRHASAVPSAVPAGVPFRFDEAAKVGTVLQLYPQTLEVFLAHGFDLLANPFLRQTLARNISIRQAAQIKNVPVDRLLKDLQQAAGPQPAREDLPAPTVAPCSRST